MQLQALLGANSLADKKLPPSAVTSQHLTLWWCAPVVVCRMPLTMEPNFEDLSCRMVFGQTPPPLDEDPALTQPCFVSCPTGNPKAASCIRLA